MFSFMKHQPVEEDHSEDPTIDIADNENIINDKPANLNSLQKRCKGCPIIIEPIMVLFMLSHFPTSYLIPQYIQQREWERLTGNTNYSNSKNKCLEMNTSHVDDPIHGNMTLASSAASYFDLELTMMQSVPAIFAMILLGPFSDRAGRKYTILSPVIGQTAAMLACTLTAGFHLPTEIILVGFFLFGCSGLFVSFFSGTYSYLADITSQERRSFRLGLAALSLLIAASVANTVTGFLVEVLGFTWIFFMLLCANFVIILYVLLLVPETVKRQPDVKFFTLAYTKKAFTVVLVDDTTKRRWKLLVLLAAFFVERLVSHSSSIDTLFSTNRPLCWGPQLVGVFGAARNAFSMVVSVPAMWLLKGYVEDEWWCIAACTFAGFADIFRYFVTTTAMMFGSGAFDFALPLFSATIRSMLSKLVQTNEIGTIMGSVAILEVISGMVGHVITNPLYAATEKTGHPSAVYIVMAALLFLCTIIMCVYACIIRSKKRRAIAEKIQ